MPVAQILFGASQALDQGQVIGLERKQPLEMKSSGKPLPLQLAVLRFKFMPGGKFRGGDGKVSRVVSTQPLPESFL
jgi:hypothetical protein